ncbi:YajQ family cyclic di-GMP-binding protein [Sneathiella limimaris]|uniref:YajQ family cyclic di-GMP-binding protein n=1 Tax=Sneathiella limimaris TaxID=1964213 RepID=UPI00146DBB7B|nr:YajQ family cyclic di-GMP-binding protein [Sneathiella limimaris]
MPSFDIVSKTDLNEVANALNNVRREIETRYDFKGSNCTIEQTDNVITIHADDDLKLRQMHELLQGHLTRRNVDAGVLEYKTPEKAAGQSVRQQVIVREGIDKELAKKLVKSIKGSKIKVQVAIQGDELRVTGKKRDDLQAVISFCKEQDTEMPLQYVNFRD